ncbi:MAG: FKBP-type peptidyl-prolyl cis-trans isomerase [Bacteroides sp.]
MKNYTFLFFCLFGLSLFLTPSCKKEKSNAAEVSDELIRLAAFQKIHYPDARMLPNHAFMHLEKSNPDGETIKPNQWLYFDYWATTLDGTYLNTCIEKQARAFRQFSHATFYAPRLKKLADDGIGREVLAALTDAHLGDEIVIGLPSSVSKYLGLWTTTDYNSALFHIIPRQQIEDPQANEKTLIAEYLKKNTGFTEHKNVYRKITEEGKGADITEKSTIWVQYAVYSLTGFLFDTNNTDIAQRHGIYSTSRKYNLLSFKAGEDSKLIKGFNGLTVGLKTGTKLQAVIPSSLAYDAKGKGEVRPYEPVCVELTIVRSSTPK